MVLPRYHAPRTELINKTDDLASRFFDVFQEGLEFLFELPPDPRARDYSSEVDRKHTLAQERLGRVKR